MSTYLILEHFMLKKIINEFPTSPPLGGVFELGKIPYFFYF